jgi:hypothetical protein
MEKEYRINDKLYLITGDPRGVALNYVSNDIGDGYIDTFNVGISYENLKKLQHELKESEFVSWETADGGLIINGRPSKIELSFNPVGHPGRKGISFDANEFDRFEEIIQEILSERS